MFCVRTILFLICFESYQCNTAGNHYMVFCRLFCLDLTCWLGLLLVCEIYQWCWFVYRLWWCFYNLCLGYLWFVQRDRLRTEWTWKFDFVGCWLFLIVLLLVDRALLWTLYLVKRLKELGHTNIDTEIITLGEKTALIKHCIDNDHSFNLDRTTVIDSSRNTNTLTFLEMCHIVNTPNTVNHRTDIDGLNTTYAAILKTIGETFQSQT